MNANKWEDQVLDWMLLPEIWEHCNGISSQCQPVFAAILNIRLPRKMYLEEIKHQAMNRKIFWKLCLWRSPSYRAQPCPIPSLENQSGPNNPSLILSQELEMFTWTMINVLMSILPWKIRSFVFVHEILPPGLSISHRSCAVGPQAPSCGMAIGECWTKSLRRDDHFSDLASSYTTSKQSQFWAVLLLWLLEKLWHRVHLLFAPDGLVDHKTLSKNTVYMSLLVVISNLHPSFLVHFDLSRAINSC